MVPVAVRYPAYDVEGPGHPPAEFVDRWPPSGAVLGSVNGYA